MPDAITIIIATASAQPPMLTAAAGPQLSKLHAANTPPNDVAPGLWKPPPPMDLLDLIDWQKVFPPAQI
eukprot:COSAG01_NODE_3456_length_6073_cov_96.792769_6_plen_69_part_00